ncbi:MAG: PEP-CTERM sorting domain-containing protein [Verrucomicrobiota bacterium]
MKTTLSALSVCLITICSASASVEIKLDFTQTGGSYTPGWDPVYANFLADTPTASITDIDGLGLNFGFNHVAVYDNGNATESLTRSGFYTYQNDTLDHSFTLSGLGVGSTVTLYACAAWDGNGRGGYVFFGDSGASGVQAQTVGDPGTSGTVANLTRIGSLVVDGSGVASGALFGAGGIGTPTEGQVGGFIFEIEPASVPEPTTLALSVLGLGGWMVSRRRSA